ALPQHGTTVRGAGDLARVVDGAGAEGAEIDDGVARHAAVLELFEGRAVCPGPGVRPGTPGRWGRQPSAKPRLPGAAQEHGITPLLRAMVQPLPGRIGLAAGAHP